MNPISEELVQQIADNIDRDSLEPAGIAEPAYNNGMSESVRELLSDEETLSARVNEVYSILK